MARLRDAFSLKRAFWPKANLKWFPVIRTGRLELIDKAGRLRGVLSISGESGAGLVLLTGNGDRQMVSIGDDSATGKNPEIAFFDGAVTTARLSLGLAKKDGTPFARFDDAKGNARVGLFLNDKEDPSLVLRGTGSSSSLSVTDNTSFLALGVGGASMTTITSLNSGGALFSMGNAAKANSLVLNLESNGDSWIRDSLHGRQ